MQIGSYLHWPSVFSAAFQYSIVCHDLPYGLRLLAARITRNLSVVALLFPFPARLREVHVVQLRSGVPRELGGVAYFAAGAAHYAPFLPVPSGAGAFAPLATAVPHRPDPAYRRRGGFRA